MVSKALSAFLESESSAEEKQKPYLQYRIGKMYAAGLGTEQDYAEAADWFTEAVNQNHKYAQYSLAGLYYRGQGVVQDYQMAFHLYRMSADQGNPYASYELAKMYRDGVGTETDGAKAGKRFEQAFSGFLSLEKNSHDDKLQYRLGQMLFTGTGTEKMKKRQCVLGEGVKAGQCQRSVCIGKLLADQSERRSEGGGGMDSKAKDRGNIRRHCMHWLSYIWRVR